MKDGRKFRKESLKKKIKLKKKNIFEKRVGKRMEEREKKIRTK